jgi:cytochrome c oxidase assembly protein subunit 15
MPSSKNNSWLHRFAVFTAVATLVLIAVGGLVTSHEAGMAVPDWPNSFGYNMFLFPVSQWAGGILYEHSHRLVASIVGVLVVALTRWLGGSRSRSLLAIIGLMELLGGFMLLRVSPELKGAGYFLSGIGGVVLAAGIVWIKNEPAAKPLPVLGWIAFWAVQVQGLVGGLRVVLSQDEIGIFHAALAQLFFVLLCVIAFLTSAVAAEVTRLESQGKSQPFREVRASLPRLLGFLMQPPAVITFLIFFQLLLGATMRHQHAGLAIPDFPLAYGKLWPAMDSDAIRTYNALRIETTNVNSITGFQVGLQMAHRAVALGILILIALWTRRVARRFGARSGLTKLAFVWLGLVIIQATLGAATIWSNKAADIATAHVVVGALLLANGALLCLIFLRSATAAQVVSRRVKSSRETDFQPIAAGAKS